ncbi:MAG TPA: SRPBCC family protein [Ktedonobacterales bacterium]
MARVYVTAERVIPAPPDVVFAFLCDYQRDRPKILPANYQHYRVTAGGVGGGTGIEYVLHAGKRERPYYLDIEEQATGRTLVERDTRSSLVNTWTVESAGDGRQSRVRIATEWQGGRGVGGFFERTFAPVGLRRIYGEMLDRLATAATSPAAGAA